MFEIPHLVLFIIYSLLGGYSIYAIDKVSKQFQIAILFCTMIITGEALMLFLSFIGKGNYIFVLLMVLAYAGTFFWLSSYTLEAKRKMMRMMAFELFLIFWFFGFYSFQDRIWPTLVVLMLSVSMIVLSLSGLLNLLVEDKRGNIFHNSLFWFYGANFGFYCFSIMLYALRALERYSLVGSFHNDLIIYGNIILYLALLYSVHLEVKKQRSL